MCTYEGLFPLGCCDHSSIGSVKYVRSLRSLSIRLAMITVTDSYYKVHIDEVWPRGRCTNCTKPL